MQHFEKYLHQFKNFSLGILFLNTLIISADWYVTERFFSNLPYYERVTLLTVIPLIAILILGQLVTFYLTKPTKLIVQAILHLDPTESNTPGPDLGDTSIGKELVLNMSHDVYHFATEVNQLDKEDSIKNRDLHLNPVATNLPLPLFILDQDSQILFANVCALQYIEKSEEDVIGKNVYNVLDFSFHTEKTLDNWLNTAKQETVTSVHMWERVRLTLRENGSDPNAPAKNRLFDLAAYYNKNNPQGYETMLVLFDHTRAYSQDDQAMSFMALAVHELRTPLTLLRGYIEALEESEKELSPENLEFLQRMDAAGRQLANFVNNILNVARIEDDQFVVKLREDNWESILNAAITDMNVRARVHGITIETSIAPGLPMVAVDRISIYEVIYNLLDNAIKYSGESKKIVVRSSLSKEGLVQTDVQDFGVGIPESILSGLFEKFYRNHRTRTQISGTGLGLYLSKTIVTTHGGNIWVQTKEGKGTTFSFTLLPYDMVAKNNQGTDDNTLRTAHGWIKNHSLYRR